MACHAQSQEPIYDAIKRYDQLRDRVLNGTETRANMPELETSTDVEFANFSYVGVRVVRLSELLRSVYRLLDMQSNFSRDRKAYVELMQYTRSEISWAAIGIESATRIALSKQISSREKEFLTTSRDLTREVTTLLKSGNLLKDFPVGPYEPK